MGYAFELAQSGIITNVDVVLATAYINNEYDRSKMRTTAGSMALANRFIKEHGDEAKTTTREINHMWKHKVHEELEEMLGVKLEG